MWYPRGEVRNYGRAHPYDVSWRRTHRSPQGRALTEHRISCTNPLSQSCPPAPKSASTMLLLCHAQACRPSMTAIRKANMWMGIHALNVRWRHGSRESVSSVEYAGWSVGAIETGTTIAIHESLNTFIL